MVLSSPMFIGRDHELEVLSKYLDSAFMGNGKTIFVSGEAGSGKTRLINEFLYQAQKKNINVITGWCLSNATIPYFPFIEAFSPFSSNVKGIFSSDPFQVISESSELVQAQPGLFNNNQTLAPQVLMDKIFSSVLKEIVYLSAKRPTILFIEDIHWADSASLALLHYISRAIPSERVFLLATFRKEELNSDVNGYPLPLLGTLRSMSREDLYETLELPNLDSIETGKMVGSILRGNSEDIFIEKLSKESQGNPLFIIESLAMLLKNGSLTKENGKWHLAADKLQTPLKIKDIILQRLGAIKVKYKRILDVASVVGEKFDAELIGAILGQDSLQILEKLDLIARSTSLVCCEDNYFRFDHAKTREVIYESIPAPLRIGYHAKIAERLEKGNKGFREFSVSDLTFHYQKAGNKKKSLEYALAAGKDALLKFSNAEAIRHFAYVLDNSFTDEILTESKTLAIEGMGDALLSEGHFVESKRYFDSLLDSDSGIVRLRAIRKSMRASFLRGNIAYSAVQLHKAKEYSHFDQLEYARVRSNVGWALGFRGKIKEAIELIEESLFVFEETYSLSDIAEAMYNLSELYVTENRSSDAIAASQRSVSYYQELGDFRGEMEALFRSGHVFFNCGLYDEALQSYSKTVEIGQRIGDYNRMAWATSYLSWVCESKGDLEQAIIYNEKTVEYSEKTDSFYSQSIAYTGFIRLYSKLGDLFNAEKYYRKLCSIQSVVTSSASKLARAVVLRSEAVLFAARGDWKRSFDYFKDSLKLLSGSLFESLTEVETRADYEWAMKKKGLFSEAEKQAEIIQNLRRKLENRLDNTNIQAFLTVHGRQGGAKDIEMGLDIVNVSKSTATLLKVKNLVPSQYLISKLPYFYSFEGGDLNLKGKKISAFSVVRVKFTLKAPEESVIDFSPTVFFADDLGKIQTTKIENCTLILQKILAVKEKIAELDNDKNLLFHSVSCLHRSTSNSLLAFGFESQFSQKAFHFLICAFIEDYMRKRLSLEQSGWRTLAEVSKFGTIPLHSVYGRSGRFGLVFIELERKGLIERHIYSGERGRGGKILRIRVNFENELVNNEVERVNALKQEKSSKS